MSLANILQATLDLGSDALDDVGLEPGRTGIYQGTPPLRCCDGDESRSLFVYWQRANVNGRDPFPARHRAEDTIAGPQWYEIRLRYLQCCTTLGEQGEWLTDDVQDCALEIANGVEAVLCAFQAIVCNQDHPFHSLTGATNCNGYIRIDEAVPLAPGPCAGFDAGITIANESAC